MANRELKTKIKLRYDLLAKWTEKNPELLAGEIAIVAIPSGVTEMQVDGSQPNPPQILFKVGPGKFNDLSYASAKAADVYGWAKAASKPTYTADEVGAYSKTELDPILAGIDTNTKYQIVKDGDNGFKLQAKEINGEWADVEGSSFKVDFEAINAAIAKKLDSETFNNFKSGYDTTIEGINESLNKKLEENDIADKADKSDVDEELGKKVNVSDYNTDIKEIEDSIALIDGELDGHLEAFGEYKTEVEGKLALKADKTDLNDYYTKSEVESTISNKGFATTSQVTSLETSINGKLDLKADKSDLKDWELKADADLVRGRVSTLEGAVSTIMNGTDPDKIDSLNDLIEWADTHAPEVSSIKEDIEANAEAIEGLKTSKADKTDLENYYNKDAIDGKVSGLEGQISGVDGKFAGYYTKEEINGKVATLEGSISAVDGKLVNYETVAEADKVRGRVSTLEGTVASLHNYNDTEVRGLISDNAGEIKTLKETTIPGLDSRIQELEGKPFDTYATKSEVSLKADKTYVDEELGKKVNIDDLNTRGYATTSQLETVSNRVKAIENDETILRSTDVFVWDCGGAE